MKKIVILLMVASVLGVLVYTRVTDNQLNMWTGLSFFLAIGCVGLLIAEIVFTRSNISSAVRLNIRLCLIVSLLMMIGLELFLRYGIAKYAVYSERNFSSKNYHSIYKVYPAHYYKNRVKNSIIWEVKPEFRISRKTNSIGLSERELPTAKEDSEYRILALGDSFTEGIGTYYDSTWVNVLAHALEASYPHKSINAFNGGIAGSDVYFSYKLMEDLLLNYQLDPDLLILAVNSSDVTDVIVRGGDERLDQDGKLVYKKAPNFEWLYAISFIVRHIMHDLFNHSFLLLSEVAQQQQEQQAIEALYSVILRFQDLAVANQFDLVVVFHPIEWELLNGHFIFSGLIDRLREKHSLHVVDLLAVFLAHEGNIQAHSADYYWPIDYHHNTKGYALMGQTIATVIRHMAIIPGEHIR